MNGVDIWLRDPRYRLIPPPEDPNNPTWCWPAQKLIQYGKELHAWVSENPSPAGIALAKGYLQTRYQRYYDHADDEHRQDKHHATHACLHRALLDISEKLDDLETIIPISDLLKAQPMPSMPTVVEGEVVDDEPVLDDVRDVILGQEQDEKPDQEDTD